MIVAEIDGPASDRKPSRGERALAWWNKHCNPDPARHVDPATRARLRRARTTLDVLRVTPAVSLARQLGAVPAARPAPDYHVRAALDLARVLAHVTEHEHAHPMASAGWKRFPGDRKESDAGEDRPKLSEARFKRLLETDDGDEKVLAFVRLVSLLGGKISVVHLTNDFLSWNHPQFGNRIRERWAFHYLAAGSAAPAPPTIDIEDDGE